jgi:hypothetical protein
VVDGSYEAMFGVPMKLGIANSVLPRNLTINMITEEDLEKAININNECTGDIKMKSLTTNQLLIWNCKVMIIQVKLKPT